MHALEQFVIDQLVRRKIEREETRTGGRYLPLSVWGKEGFNMKDIEEKCHDKKSSRSRVNISGQHC